MKVLERGGRCRPVASPSQPPPLACVAYYSVVICQRRPAAVEAAPFVVERRADGGHLCRICFHNAAAYPLSYIHAHGIP